MNRIILWINRRKAARNMNRFQKDINSWMSGKVPSDMNSQDVLECYTICILFRNGTPVMTYNIKLIQVLHQYGFHTVQNGIGWNINV